MNIAQGMPHISSERALRMQEFSRCVAILPWFNIDVLHKLYLNFFKTAAQADPNEEYRERSITCADLLHSPYVKRIHYNVFVIEPEAQSQLRKSLMDHPAMIEKIGQFMLAYASQCRQHFMSPKYLESYRVEGNLILNPTAEAERITQHIVDRINQQDNLDAKKNAVGYYLNVLNRNKTTNEQNELIKFLEGLQSYEKDNTTLPKEWQDLKSKNEKNGSITIKLSKAIKSSILSQLDITQQTSHSSFLNGLIIGIDDYLNEEIYSLQEASNDAIKVHDYLTDHVKNLKKTRLRLLTNKNATRKNIIAEIESLAKKSKEGDTFIFYFAGYGATEGGHDPSAKYQSSGNVGRVNREEKTILSHDFSTDNPGFALSELTYLLNDFPENSTCVVILDCSFKRANDRTYEQNVSANKDLIRSLPWKESQRIDNQFIYAEEYPVGSVPPNFSGITIFAVNDNEDATETENGGLFTTHLLKTLANNGNKEPYQYYGKKEYNAEAGESKWPSYEITGQFDINETFLNGHLNTKEKDYKRVIQLCIETKQSILDLSGLGLTYFPKEIIKINHLETLIISGNQIKFIPVAIKEMPNLKTIDFSNNPILHLPKSLHKTSIDEFEKYFENELRPKSNTPCAILIGIDYDEKLPHVNREIIEINELLSANGVIVFQLINPVAEDLFNFIYQHQNNINIFHFAAFRMDQLKDSDDEIQALKNEDWVEMFSCIRQTPFSDAFAFLNCCDSRELMMDLSTNHVPRGIALPGLVQDNLAYEVAVAFYKQIVEGKNLQDAFEETRIQFAD